MREHSGHTLKSSLKHILNVDRRNDPIFPSQGTLLRLSQEFAGLGGNIGFFKNELELQVNPVPKFIYLLHIGINVA